MDLQKSKMNLNDAMQYYNPTDVLCIYTNNKNNTYIEHTKIENNKPGASNPLSIQNAKNIFSNITANESGMVTCNGLLPRNVLSFNTTIGDYSLVWHCKSIRRTLKFHKDLDIPNFNIKMPELIFKATRNNLYVYAVKKNSRFTEMTVLFETPFMNIFDDGKVCLGNAKINIDPITTIQEIIAEYEKVFWHTEFTDSGNKRYLKMWYELSKYKAEYIHNNSLISTKKYLKDILK